MALFEQATEQSKNPGVKMDAPLLADGGYPARLLRIVDLGEQPGTAQFPTPAYKLSFVFECLDEFMVDEDGKELEDVPREFEYEVSYNTDGYMSSKSTIHKVMTALNGFGKPLQSLLGTACTISLVQKATKSDATKMYNKVTGVMAMRAKDAERYGPLKMKPFVFSLDANATKEQFEELSKRGGQFSQQAKIKQSLSLHKDAPQLAAALGVERPEMPPVEEQESADFTQSDADLAQVMGGTTTAPEIAEDDPFA